MSTKNFTPGPWILSYSEEGFGDHEIEAASNGLRNATGDFGRVVRLSCCKDADARLIAAAPDLLEALQDIGRIASAASIGMPGNQKRLERARAAIQKAIGAKQ